MKSNAILIIAILLTGAVVSVGFLMTNNVEPKEETSDVKKVFDSKELIDNFVSDSSRSIGVAEITLDDDSNKKNILKKDETILFVSENCSHCLSVGDYIEDNNVKHKISLKMLDVYAKERNLIALKQAVSKCELTDYGVPFLWVGGNCYEGKDEVLGYFDKILENH